MSFTAHLMREHDHRTGAPGDMALDAAYQYQRTLLREMLSRLEVILADEGVEQSKAERILRCLLYGAPSEAEARYRMEQQERMTEILQRTSPVPLFGP